LLKAREAEGGFKKTQLEWDLACIYQKDIYHNDMKKTESNGRINQSLFAMLGLLSLGPRTGYELRKLSEESIQHFWRESYGQIYPSLRVLEEQGLVTRRPETGAVRGRPNRQVYAITEAGEDVLREWVRAPAKPEVPRNELLLKIFFGRRVPAETNLLQIAEHRQRFAKVLEGYEATEQQIRNEHREHPDLVYWLLTLAYGKKHAQAQIAWCDEALAQLNEIGIQERGTANGGLAQTPLDSSVFEG
jgi:DNA-binding PadR family transcriptional regulator